MSFTGSRAGHELSVGRRYECSTCSSIKEKIRVWNVGEDARDKNAC